MDILQADTRPVKKANPDRVTGEMWDDPIASAAAPANGRVVREVFKSGARTAWHSHPLGQTLYVLSGAGFIGRRQPPPHAVKSGDSVWIEADEEHWHGAAPNAEMEYIAFHAAAKGYVSVWMEYVSEEDYPATTG